MSRHERHSPSWYKTLDTIWEYWGEVGLTPNERLLVLKRDMKLANEDITLFIKHLAVSYLETRQHNEDGIETNLN